MNEARFGIQGFGFSFPLLANQELLEDPAVVKYILFNDVSKLLGYLPIHVVGIVRLATSSTLLYAMWNDPHPAYSPERQIVREEAKKHLYRSLIEASGCGSYLFFVDVAVTTSQIYEEIRQRFLNP